MDKSYSIDVVCLFCDSALEAQEDRDYQSGDLIKCKECGELNDYDSVLEHAKEKAVKLVEKELDKDIKRISKNMFKK